MIVVSVTLHSARTHKSLELARMEICNDEAGGTAFRNYLGRVLRGRSTVDLNRRVVHRRGAIRNWPSERVHVWNLVQAMLTSCGYGAQPQGCAALGGARIGGRV